MLNYSTRGEIEASIKVSPLVWTEMSVFYDVVCRDPSTLHNLPGKLVLIRAETKM